MAEAETADPVSSCGIVCSSCRTVYGLFYSTPVTMRLYLRQARTMAHFAGKEAPSGKETVFRTLPASGSRTAERLRKHRGPGKGTGGYREKKLNRVTMTV